jgi:DNA-binding GntR family transcriptional regulator
LQSLADIAYRQIRDAIVQGRLESGRRLVYRAVAEELGISPTPVRDAIQRMVSEGALQLDERGVASVPVITAGAYIEIVNLRVVLEGMAAAAIAARPDRQAIADALAAIHEKVDRHQAQGPAERALFENERFHREFVGAAGMPVLSGLVRSLWLRCGPSLRLRYTEGFQRLAVHPHLRLIDAVRAGDARAAREAVQQDLWYAGLHILSRIEPGRVEPAWRAGVQDAVKAS